MQRNTTSAEKNIFLFPAGVPTRRICCDLGGNGQNLRGEDGRAGNERAAQLMGLEQEIHCGQGNCTTSSCRSPMLQLQKPIPEKPSSAYQLGLIVGTSAPQEAKHVSTAALMEMPLCEDNGLPPAQHTISVEGKVCSATASPTGSSGPAAGTKCNCLDAVQHMESQSRYLLGAARL